MHARRGEGLQADKPDPIPPRGELRGRRYTTARRLAASEGAVIEIRFVKYERSKAPVTAHAMDSERRGNGEVGDGRLMRRAPVHVHSTCAQVELCLNPAAGASNGERTCHARHRATRWRAMKLV
jgi:hypothetical protein